MVYTLGDMTAVGVEILVQVAEALVGEAEAEEGGMGEVVEEQLVLAAHSNQQGNHKRGMV